MARGHSDCPHCGADVVQVALHPRGGIISVEHSPTGMLVLDHGCVARFLPFHATAAADKRFCIHLCVKGGDVIKRFHFGGANKGSGVSANSSPVRRSTRRVRRSRRSHF